MQPPLEPAGEKNVHRIEPLTTSEDFSVLADAFGTPYCFWLLGGAPEGVSICADHRVDWRRRRQA
ncbi:hypothetical protein NY055_03960 [Corynebacterium diphtheriae bv. mitis]|nr:hypothetical protein NY055_03960 [Corynebacterium diphtheriae bv. mitis]